ncbi:unnamed protein product [Durusdinium trenchii]|uniref:Uncharacterized protein n=1 Tax=Durusdinium trenchii TaxID=1381693 RepID=A0ABP0I0B5_9DINO
MVATKSRVPTSPKPVMARPRKGMNKVVEMNDFCARMVVDDLIQNALKEDAVAAAEELQCESEDEGSVVEAYDDYDEDDVVSLSGEADSDEEEVETFNMVCQVAKRAVTQSLHQAKWISSSAPVVRQIQTLPADAWQAIHARFQVSGRRRPPRHLIKTLPSTAWDAIHQRFHPQAAGIGSRAPRQIQTLPADAWQAIHARFQVAPVPQVGMHLKTLPSTAWDAIHQRFQVATSCDALNGGQVKEVKEETAPAPPAAPAAVEPKESEPARRISTAKSKRRIIGAIVPAAPAPDAVAPTEKRPENPAPPAEKRPMNWFMAGSVSNGLRQREVMTFNMADEEDKEEKRMKRKSSLTNMFQAMGSAQLIRMDVDDDDEATFESLRNRSRQGGSAGTSPATSAMALDLGLDMKKDRLGSSMGARHGSLGALRKTPSASRLVALPALQKGNGPMDWSVTNSISVTRNHSWALNASRK